MRRGIVPSLSRMRLDGGMHEITTVFPSVTGPAYAPFLMGRYPGPIGLPGLRWYDRARTAARMPGNSRSYVGFELSRVDSDIDEHAPTIFELASSGLGALNWIGRGLPRGHRIGRSTAFAIRAGITHFRGNVEGWLAIDREVAARAAREIRSRNPDFAFVALTGIDKTSHSQGHAGPHVDRALTIVDGLVGDIRRDAEERGAWNDTHVWVVSDHGHSPVSHHEDLAGLVAGLGFRTIAHPFVTSWRGEVAVMVSGNAMAHIYLDLPKRIRPWGAHAGDRWKPIIDCMLSRESVDLMILPIEPGKCEIHGSRGRGHAVLSWKRGSIDYVPVTGDPIGVGLQRDLSDDDAFSVTRQSDYPDSLVQISTLSDSPRSGEIILSASRDWDFRAKYEPIPHFSSHGALHREHMLVPLLVNHPVAVSPRRTVDVMPSALEALGIPIPDGLDGVSFV